ESSSSTSRIRGFACMGVLRLNVIALIISQRPQTAATLNTLLSEPIWPFMIASTIKWGNNYGTLSRMRNRLVRWAELHRSFSYAAGVGMGIPDAGCASSAGAVLSLAAPQPVLAGWPALFAGYAGAVCGGGHSPTANAPAHQR